MTEQSPSRARIRFGGFELDLQSRELFKAGQRIPLANQSFLALAALLERPGQLVSREELRRRIWPDSRVVEFDQGLNSIINRLREALGPAPGGGAFIETLPRRGYRFIGEIQAGRAPGPPRQLLPWAIAIAFCTVAAVATATLLTRGGARDGGGGPRVEPVTSLIGREVAPVFDPSGERLLFAWNGGAAAGPSFDLYSKRLDSEHLVRITHEPATAVHAAWAPHGAQIAVARESDHGSGIYLLAPGGSERLLAAANFLDEAFMQSSWSPDGHQLAYAALVADGFSHIHIADVPGARLQVLDRPGSCADAGLPAFSPDGRWLAFVCTSSFAVYDIDVRELATGAVRSLASLEGEPQGLAWTADGQALVVANDADIDSGIWRITLGGQSSRLLRSQEPLGPGITVAAQRIAFVHEDRIIDIWRADLTDPSAPSSSLISSTREQLVPAYSPDGQHIAFQSNRSGTAEIWLADAAGHNLLKLTDFNGPLTGAPSYCSDGRRIAFDSRASGRSAIYVLDILAGQAQRLQTSVANLALPVWSQDCRWIIASDGRTSLYRVSVSDGRTARFTDQRAYRAVVAGARVIFNVVRDGGIELWSKPVAGGREAPLAGMPRLRYGDSWTATARGIYFTSSSAAGLAVSFHDFASQQTHVVRRLAGSVAALGGLGLAVSRDEHWLLYTRASREEDTVMMISDGPGPAGLARYMGPRLTVSGHDPVLAELWSLPTGLSMY